MDPWLDRWNERYRKEEYAFGTEPNEYLKEQLSKLPPGKILFAAEGEGRNAVFAAGLGWTVSAFDISAEGKKKALRLAEAHHVTLDYQVGELPSLKFEPDQFDAIALIYAHFPAEIKSTYHRRLDKFLRPGGTIIFEAFSKKHLAYKQKNPHVGGPSDLESLFSEEELLSDFRGYEIVELKEEEIELEEGAYHQGKGSVMRFVGRKA
jgi:2-polyprenyl-3-methyl-5-hydroxy-6-metoxy-1,4-benzoquinol methylase